MKTQIISKNLKLTEGLRNRVDNELDKLNNLLIHDRNSTSIVVTLSVEHKKHICHINISHRKNVTNVTKESDDMYNSIEEAFDSVTRKIRKHKEKKMDKVRQERFDKIINDEELELESELESE